MTCTVNEALSKGGLNFRTIYELSKLTGLTSGKVNAALANLKVEKINCRIPGGGYVAAYRLNTKEHPGE